VIRREELLPLPASSAIRYVHQTIQRRRIKLLSENYFTIRRYGHLNNDRQTKRDVHAGKSAMVIESTTPTNEASQVNHSSKQRQSRLLADIAIEEVFHRSNFISINACFRLSSRRSESRSRLGRKIIQEQSGRERASNTGTGAGARGERTRPVRISSLLFGLPEPLPFTCSAWCMRPHQRERTKDAQQSRVAGRNSCQS
jgi:hypothetical protein